MQDKTLKALNNLGPDLIVNLLVSVFICWLSFDLNGYSNKKILGSFCFNRYWWCVYMRLDVHMLRYTHVARYLK
jgi:hypothetical protein